MKLLRFIICLLSIVVMHSCAEENIEINNDVIEVVASANLNTKTTYSSENGATYVSWKEGDAIGLFTKDFANLRYTADQSGPVTTFSGAKLEVDERDSVYAYYPYSSNDNTFIPLPGIITQYQTTGPAGYDCMYAVGVVKNKKVELKFQHLFAILKVTFPTKMLSGLPTSGIECVSTEPCAVNGGVYDIVSKSYGTTYKYNSITYYIDRDSLKDEYVTFYITVLPQSENSVIEFRDKPASFNYRTPNVLFVSRAPKGGFKAGYVYNLNLGDEERIETRRAKDIEALRALYNATDGDNWRKKTNWFTDEPVYTWYGLGEWNYLQSEAGKVESIQKMDYARELSLRWNNLTGSLPPEFTYWMDNVKTIDIGENNLSGKIPEQVMQHPRWNEIGWNVIHQYTNLGYGFDLSNGSNLYEKNQALEYLNGEQIMSHDLFRQNKINLVCKTEGNTSIYLGVKRINLLLSYKNKGFEIVLFHQDDELEQSVENADSFPIKDGITNIYARYNRTSDLYMQEGLSHCQSFYLLDENSSVIEFFYELAGDANMVAFNDAKLEQILFARLGEPEEHEEYLGPDYTSTDYTLDGSVVTLQKATVGKGIDLVFMGDAYVDKDMTDGGKYERHMKQSMEYFFDIEPYKSFRNRFNVYAVKVISANDLTVENGTQKINFNDEICFEYARKIQGVDLDNVTIVNVVNNPNDFVASGYANMYESGASVAHIQVGGPSHIIIHEAGGHGFAKLLDEYISGNEQVAAENLSSFRSWLKTEYHNKGWGVNLDATDDPESIIWSHFLNDSRYASEVGVYKGAWNWPNNLWRSSENSVMNNDYSWFNAPSREAIYKRIMKLSEGDDWVYSYENFVEYDKINRNSQNSVKSTHSKDNKKQINHQPPTIIKGSWRDAHK